MFKLITFWLLSILAHELGHYFAARYFNVPIKRLVVNWFGVGICREFVPGWRGAVISLAGPAVSLMLATCFVRYPNVFNINFALFLVNVSLPKSDIVNAYRALKGA